MKDSYIKKSAIHGMVILVAAFAVFACRSRQQERVPLPGSERIAFYTVEATRDTAKNDPYSRFRIVKVQVVDGKLNFRSYEEKRTSPFHLGLVLEQKHRPPIRIYADHPLYRTVDLYEETGEITSKFLSLPKAQFTFRAPWFGDPRAITITETVNSKSNKPIRITYEK